MSKQCTKTRIHELKSPFTDKKLLNFYGDKIQVELTDFNTYNNDWIKCKWQKYMVDHHCFVSLDEMLYTIHERFILKFYILVVVYIIHGTKIIHKIWQGKGSIRVGQPMTENKTKYNKKMVHI